MMSLQANAVSLAALLSLSSAAYEQDFPSKPIRIVTGSAGGSTDFTARQVGRALASALGQPVVIDNQTQVMQTELVLKAPADGYTLLITGGSLWIFPLMRKTPYEPLRDFAPITAIEQSVNALVVHPSLPPKSVSELIALARSRPGELNYASAGTGSTPHLAGELFKSMAKVDMVHVPYKGNAQALTDLIGGQVQLGIPSLPSVMPHIKSGRLRAIAVTSAASSALLPGLPTVATTVPGYECVGITAFFAPAKTPAAIIKRLNEEAVRYLRTAEAKEVFLKNGAETIGNSPDQLAAASKAEIERFGKLIKDLGLRLE